MPIRPILLTALVLTLCAGALPAWSENFVANVVRDALDVDGVLPCDVGGPGVDYTPNIPGDALAVPCSLRAAIVLANLTPETDGILLDLNPNREGPGVTYELTLKGPGEDAGLTGDLDVTTPISITGEGTARGFEITFIDAKGIKDRIFDVHPGADLNLRQTSLQNGQTPKNDFDAGFPGELSGGCMRSAGIVTLNGVYFYRCSSSDDGGGASVIGGTLNATNVNFGFCKAKNEGGGLEAAAGTTRLVQSTFGRNRAGTGGGIASRADLTLRNVTIDSNRAKLGGGLAVLGAGPTSISHATISENAKVNVDATQNTGALVVGGSIVWGAATDCAGTVPSSGGNLEGGNSCGFTGTNDQHGDPALDLELDPLLAPLNMYDGLVPTRTLATDSPAIDHGLDDDAGCSLDARLKYRARRSPSGVAISDAGATDFATPVSGPVTITSTPVTTATVGVPYTYDVETTNPAREPCVDFALTLSSPLGMSIDPASGLVSWTPTADQVGSNPVGIEATSKGASADGEGFSITVAPAP